MLSVMNLVDQVRQYSRCSGMTMVGVSLPAHEQPRTARLPMLQICACRNNTPAIDYNTLPRPYLKCSVQSVEQLLESVDFVL